MFLFAVADGFLVTVGDGILVAVADLIGEGTAALAHDLARVVLDALRALTAAVVPLEARLRLHATFEQVDDVVEAVAAWNHHVRRGLEAHNLVSCHSTAHGLIV